MKSCTQARPKKNLSPKLMAYVTPQKADWPPELRALAATDLAVLCVIHLDAEYRVVRGGKAPVTNLKKTAVVRAKWIDVDVETRLTTVVQKNAFQWLMTNNDVYCHYVKAYRYRRRELDAEQPPPEAGAEQAGAPRDMWKRLWPAIPTAELLLKMPGVEIAARPWLYPRAAFGDTDIKVRLGMYKRRLALNAQPNLKTSFFRKLTSRCVSYEEDFPLQCLIHDVSLARQLQGISTKAAELKMAPDALPKTQNFANFWMDEKEKLEDMCRQHGDMPNLFFTVAPAEWKYPTHCAMPGWRKQHAQGPDSLSGGQVIMALHMYHTLDEIIRSLLTERDICRQRIGIADVHDFCLRFEYQGRGTIHVHVVAWVTLVHGPFPDPAARLSGKTGEAHTSRLVTYLESVFNASVDVQCGRGEHCLLRYVTGYVSKASDALNFKANVAAESGDATSGASWRQIYRMLCKNAPLQQEMAVQFGGMPLIRASFLGDNLFAPIPGSKAVNSSRHVYNAYLQRPPENEGDEAMAFIDWARLHKVIVQKPEVENGEFHYEIKRRAERGVGSHKERCALGIRFAFEMLDIYMGSWLAVFVPHRSEQEFLLSAEDEAKTPEGARFVAAALRHPAFGGDVRRLLRPIVAELQLRGVDKNRRITFCARIRATALLLEATWRGDIDPASWSAKCPVRFPDRCWSPQQQQLLAAVTAVLDEDDANEFNANARNYFVTGCPGTGKTEVLIQCALTCAENNGRVLIACPTALLQDTYNMRMPLHENISIQTVHSTFRITRDADEVYVPPGRLRHLDLIIFDEVSTLDKDVWRKIKVALSELTPAPVCVWAGDFSQLQSVTKETHMRDDMHREVACGNLRHVELLQHEFARSNDESLLSFLSHVRSHQPTRSQLTEFFGPRRIPSDPDVATAAALRLEAQTGKRFTFLTVTNAAAEKYNAARLRVQFRSAIAALGEDGVPGDPTTGGGTLSFVAGMRVRLTRNVDKQRGFVNGALGVIEHVLRKDVFVLKTMHDVRILVHPVRFQNLLFMPVTFAYATTVRRAQGATLEMGGLRFDRRRPDRGYAYVGASRFKRRADISHIGHIRRTDWLPVGGDRDNNEQHFPGVDSSSSGSDEEEEDQNDESETQVDSVEEDSDPESCDLSRLQYDPEAQQPDDLSCLFT